MGKLSLDMFDDIERITQKKAPKPRRGPYNYPGSKYRSVKKIVPLMKLKPTYVEVFGGSGVVLLNRPKVKTEVFNDRDSGITAFYRALRNPETKDDLIDRIRLSLHSREEWQWCKDTWQHDALDDVERGYRWYYHIAYSFGTVGRNFGRTVASNIARAVGSRLDEFQGIHDRIKYVLIENLDWRDCLRDFDSFDTVFYLDPPYYEVHPDTYREDDINHKELLDAVFKLDGTVYMSSYSNALYDSYPWDDAVEWQLRSVMQGYCDNESSLTRRKMVTECLYIKE